MSDTPPDLASLINWPTLITTLLIAIIVGGFASWQQQQALAADLRRVEGKLDEVVAIIEAAHPRRGTDGP